MSLMFQGKLLRVLQEGEVRRVGDSRARKVDVRVVTATNRDLEALVAEGRFRQDLYYRIHVVRVDLPPLRARMGDLPELVAHLVRVHGGGRTLELPAETMGLLRAHTWPGNVRELENEVRRWLALCERRVGPEDLSPAIRGAAPEASEAAPTDPDDLTLKAHVEALERRLLRRALAHTGGNQTQAAKLLGLSRYGLQKKLQRLGVPVPR